MNIHAIILAAGKGTRLKDKYSLPKSLLPLAGKPAVGYVLENLQSLGIPITVVVKHRQKQIKEALGDTFSYVEQGEKKGTGAAFMYALEGVEDIKKARHIMVFNADDSAFLEKSTKKDFLSFHSKEGNVLTVMTVVKDDPTDFGRIIKEDGNLIAIMEEKEASFEEKLISEVNTGVFCFNTDWVIKVIESLTSSPVTGDYYINRLVDKAVAEGKKVGTFLLEDERQWFGFNTLEQYEEARRRMESRLEEVRT